MGIFFNICDICGKPYRTTNEYGNDCGSQDEQHRKARGQK